MPLSGLHTVCCNDIASASASTPCQKFWAGFALLQILLVCDALACCEVADNKSKTSIIPATLPERMPDTRSLHQYFTSSILLDCSQLNNEEVPEQVGHRGLCMHAL